MGTTIERLRFATILRDIAPESELSPRGLGRIAHLTGFFLHFLQPARDGKRHGPTLLCTLTPLQEN
jgi:hypothetical protein